MRKQKSFLLALSLVLLFGSVLPVRANQTLTEDGSVNIPLTAVIESKYSVSIPASLTLTPGTEEADGTPFSGTVTVGVKGNINPGKAVVVVPTNGVLEGSGLSADSIAAGNSAVEAVTTEALNALTDAYDTDITITGTSDASATATVKAASQYVRWANNGVTTLAKCETNLNASTYTNGTVALNTKLSAADTYKGNLQFTFKLVDRK